MSGILNMLTLMHVGEFTQPDSSSDLLLVHTYKQQSYMYKRCSVTAQCHHNVHVALALRTSFVRSEPRIFPVHIKACRVCEHTH